VQNCDFIPSPRAEDERQAFVAWGRVNWCTPSLAYHWARMIELLHSVEVIAELLDDPALLSGDCSPGRAPAQWRGHHRSAARHADP
jgi:NAD-reducing hydrogenase large subunit